MAKTSILCLSFIRPFALPKQNLFLRRLLQKCSTGNMITPVADMGTQMRRNYDFEIKGPKCLPQRMMLASYRDRSNHALENYFCPHILENVEVFPIVSNQ